MPGPSGFPIRRTLGAWLGVSAGGGLNSGTGSSGGAFLGSLGGTLVVFLLAAAAPSWVIANPNVLIALLVGLPVLGSIVNYESTQAPARPRVASAGARPRILPTLALTRDGR